MPLRVRRARCRSQARKTRRPSSGVLAGHVRPGQVVDANGAAEADVVFAGQRVIAALKLTIRLALEVRIKRAAAQAFQHGAVAGLVGRFVGQIERSKIVDQPFPDVAHHVERAVGAPTPGIRASGYCRLMTA